MTRTASPNALMRLAVIASLFLATAFTAPSVGAVEQLEFDQCANGTGAGPTCSWITSNLQQGNSYWTEGDVVPQRVFIPGLTPGGAYRIQFRYTTTKGGDHAYDFLATFDATENWITLEDRCTGFPADCTTGTDLTAPMQPDPAIAAAAGSALDTAFGSRNFTLRGVSSASASAPSLFSGTYTGDSDYIVNLDFTAATSRVYIWYGGHLATAAGWGAGNSASEISGASFHQIIESITGINVGNRDNMLMLASSTPLPGSLQLAATLAGGPAGYTGPFRLSYTCGAPASVSGYRDVTAGQSVTVTGISDGSTCSVTSTPPAAPGGYQWGATTWSPVSQSVSISSGTTKTVTANFTLSAIAGPSPTPTPAPVAPAAGLSVAKTAGLSADGPWVSSLETDAGTPVWYRIVVTNSGGVALTGVTVADSMTDDTTPPDCPAIPASLAAGATWTCTYSVEAPDGTSTNTVTADSDQTGPATASAEVLAAEVLPATDRTGRLPLNPIERYAPLGLGLGFAALLVILSVGLPERRRR